MGIMVPFVRAFVIWLGERRAIRFEDGTWELREQAVQEEKEKLFVREEVLRLPEMAYDGGDEEEGDVGCCSICLDEFEEGGMLRVLLPCRHMFHTDCIVPWLTERKTYCPLCKT